MSPDSHLDDADLRSTLLREAVRLCLSDGVGSVWAFAAGQVKVTDVAAELGLGRTAVYRLWGTQDEYREDLLLYACSRRSQPVITDDEFMLWDADLNSADAPDSADLAVAGRRALGAASQRLASGGWPALTSALAGYVVPPQLGELDAGLREHSVSSAAAHLALLGRRAGRVPVAAASWRDVAEVMDAIAGGFSIAHQVAPWLTGSDWLVDDDGAEWSLLAAAAREVLTRLTMPADRSTDATDQFERSLDSSAPEHRDLATSSSVLRRNLEPSWTNAQHRALQAGVDLLARSITARESVEAFGAVTVARVARAAGVSRQTVYTRWSSDDELRADVLEYLVDAHIRSWHSADHDPWHLTNEWETTLAFAQGFLSFHRAIGPRLPWLAFAPYVHQHRVRDILHGLSHYCIDHAARVVDRHLLHFGLPLASRLSVGQLGEIGYVSWLGVRRRAQVRLSTAPTEEVWRHELRLTSLLVHLFSGTPDENDLPRLLDPISAVQLRQVRT